MNKDKKNNIDKEHKINIDKEHKINIDKEHKINIKPDVQKKEDHVVVDGKKYQFEPDEEFSVKSCCGSNCLVDKPFLEFIAKTVVSLSVLSFCFLQLSRAKQSEFASSTISLILGTYLGSTISSNNNNKK